MALIDELSSLLNQHSAENASDTPDYLLAGYLAGCLEVYNRTVQQREMWHGRARPDITPECELIVPLDPIKPKEGQSDGA